MNTDEIWSTKHSIVLTILVAVVVILGLQTGPLADSEATPWTWYLMMLTLLGFVVVAGHGMTGRLLGFLIDSRNKMTLSRFQLVIWTVVILGTYMTVVLARLANDNLGYEGAFLVAMPQELWMLMGISLTSLVGSPLILSGKKQIKPDPQERDHTRAQLVAFNGLTATPTGGAQIAPATAQALQQEAEKSSVGTVMVNALPSQARLADLFRGDESGNAAHLDMSKIQMFFFTIILVITYLFGLQAGFADMIVASEAEFPLLDSSMITLLGISHAGYLSYKAVPHSKPADP